jgi:hypothetical protein
MSHRIAGIKQFAQLVCTNVYPASRDNFVLSRCAASLVTPEAGKYLLGGTNFSYHRVNVSDNGTAIMAIIQPQSGAHVSVYIKYGDYPNDTYYDWVDTIPGTPSAERSQYLYYPPQHITELNGSYVIGIRVNSSEMAATFSAYFVIVCGANL